MVFDRSEFRGLHKREPSFLTAVVGFIGHLLGGAVLFASIALVSWVIGWGIAKLHVIHPFPPTVFSALHGVESALLYIDILVSGIVIIVGAWRFIKELLGIDHS